MNRSSQAYAAAWSWLSLTHLKLGMHVFTESRDAKVGSTPTNAHIDCHTAIFSYKLSSGTGSCQAGRELLFGAKGKIIMAMSWFLLWASE